MQKVLDFFNKYSNLIVAAGAAAWIILGIFGFDVIGRVFYEINLFFLVRLVYIAVGLVGVLKLLEMFRPELFEKLVGKKKK